MKVQALRAALAFALLCSFVALAGQDRALYAPGGGPGQGGVIRSLFLVSPTSTYWAAIEGGGIYKSIDGGATWTASHQGLGNKMVRAVTVAPGGTTTMYAVTNGGGGFYKSTDSGANWSVSNTGLSCTFQSNLFVITTGANTGRVYLAGACSGGNGVFMSTDQGASWALVSGAGIPGPATVVTISGSTDGSVLRAATSAGVHYSFDFGATWTPRNAGLPSGPTGPSVLATTVLGSNTLAATDGNGVFYSPDSGLNWSPSTGLPTGANILGGFSVVGTTAYVFVDGAGMYRTDNNGLSWSADTSFNGLPVKRARSVFREGAGPVYWAGTFSGVYKSIDGAVNWTKMSNGLPQGFIANAAGVPGAPQTFFAAADTLYKSIDGGLTWNTSDVGLGGLTFVSSLFNRGVGVVQVDPSNASIMYISTVNFGMFKTIDGGANWSNVSGSLATVLVRAPAIDPTNPSIVYAATSGGLYKSTDGGTSWLFKHPGGGFSVPFNTTRPQVMTGAPQNVLLAVANNDARDVVLSAAGVYLSTNGGDSWKQLVSNEKVTQAIFVSTPGSSKVNIYVNSLGYFDQPSAGQYSSGGVYRCVDVLNDFQPDRNCTAVDLGADPGLIRSFTARSNRVAAIATTSGLAKHEFMFFGPDFNNDSRGDILWRNPTSGGTTIWQMAGAHLLGERDTDGVAPLRTVTSPWSIAGFGDFDGDGTSDILWRNSSTGENYIYFMDGGIILPSEGYIRTIADQTWVIAGVGDFDGDGRSDILWRNTVSGDNYIYFMNGLQIVNEGYIRSVADQNWSVAAVGDFNGNGKADVLWRNGSTGDNYIYLMNGTAIAGEGYTRTVPVVWQVKALGDFNQDNKMDIVWRNSSTGENYVYPMDGVAILPSETYLP